MRFVSYGLAVLFLVGARGEEIPRWSVAEISLQSGKNYGESYPVVQLTADITGPSGRHFVVPGFFDGGRSFKIRWTPTSGGTWKYTTHSTDADLDGRHGSVLASSALPGTHGFLRRDPQHPYSFIYQDGSHCFLFGNTYYELLLNEMQNGGWKLAIDNTRRYGMNKIRFFVDLNGAEGDTYGLDHVKLDDWAKADQAIRYMAVRGIVADLIIFRRTQVNAMNMEQTQRYLRYVLARYAAFPNVIWCLTNEWEYSNKPKHFWSELGRLASQEDPWARREGAVRGLSIHQQTRYDWDLFGDSWHSHAIIQFGVRNRGKASRGGDEWHLPKDRTGLFRFGDDWGNFGITFNWGHNFPVVNDEYGYIGEPADESEARSGDGKPVRFSREKHRRTMWSIYVAGGYGSTGDKNQYADGRPYKSANWHDEPEFGDVGRLIDFYMKKDIRYWELSAHNEAVKSGRRVYVETGPSRQYVIYAAAGGSFSINLAAGRYHVHRYNPRTGFDSPIGMVNGGKVRSITTPDQQDWVVYLKPVEN